MYKAKQDFHDPRVGRVKTGQKVENSVAAEELFKNGYLVEYKTKVVKQSPEKTTKKRKSKKASKK